MLVNVTSYSFGIESIIDSNVYFAEIANGRHVGEKAYRRALQILCIVKENRISHGKEPNALAVAVLDAACLKEGEKVSQAQIAVAGDTSIVTQKKISRLEKIFP